MNKLNQNLQQKMQKEAVARMRALHLLPQIIAEFENEGIVNYSERSPLGGILYWLHNNEDWVRRVEEFEDEHHALVFHATHEYTQYGELLSLLYVSSYTEEWEMDREDIKDNSCFVYVINLDYPDCSEFGSIGVKEAAGGLIRTW